MKAGHMQKQSGRRNGIYDRTAGRFLKNMISNHTVQMIKIISIVIEMVQCLIDNVIGFKPGSDRMSAGSQEKTV